MKLARNQQSNRSEVVDQTQTACRSVAEQGQKRIRKVQGTTGPASTSTVYSPQWSSSQSPTRISSPKKQFQVHEGLRNNLGNAESNLKLCDDIDWLFGLQSFKFEENILSAKLQKVNKQLRDSCGIQNETVSCGSSHCA